MFEFEYHMAVLGNQVFFQVIKQSRAITDFFYWEREYEFADGINFRIESDSYNVLLLYRKIYIRSSYCKDEYELVSRQFDSEEEAKRYYELATHAITKLLHILKGKLL